MADSKILSRPALQSENQGYNFGTFQGVFTPSILTILGVVMYLRFGWVLGNVGLTQTLIIVTAANVITFLTGLSLSSLATNMKVGGGGAYFIISRSLGIEAGAAVGLPLFIAQALSISFYIAGFSESVHNIWPIFNEQLIGIITLFVLGAVVFTSADIALKIQFFILAAIGLSLVSLFMGDTPNTYTVAAPVAETISKESFWTVFAVFFPAVTGILAGVAMSGDLKNPARSLPLGTLGAIFAGYVIYMVIPVFLSSVVNNDAELINNSLLMRDIARWGDIIVLGLWGAALSSAMGSLLGAPRTLQALALDGVVPRFFGKSYGSKRDPRIATVLAFVIGFVGILLGDLNAIAPVLTMFFLTSYGLLNISAGLEEVIGSPSWRPAFRVSAKINFIAGLLCFGVMFMINAGATIVAIAISVAVYYAMERRKLVARWGDVRYGILMLMAEYAIRKLSWRKPDVRTWKPNVLVLSGSPKGRWHLIEFGHALTENRSLMSVATVVTSDSVTENRAQSTEKTIRDYLRKKDVHALVKVLRAEKVLDGLETLVRAYGFGPLVPNTVVVGKSENLETGKEYVSLVSAVRESGKNLIVLSGDTDDGIELKAGSRIDIWWSGKSANGGLMLALAQQLRRHSGWVNAKLVVKAVVQSAEEGSDGEKLKVQLQEFLKKERVTARVELVTRTQEDIFADIRQSSQGACLVFLGMRSQLEGESQEEFEKYYRELLEHTRDLPPTAFVHAAEDVQFSLMFSSADQ